MTDFGLSSAAALRQISTAEFARRVRHMVAKHDARLVWLLGAGCSVSSGVGDAAEIARGWLTELKYLETGDAGSVEDWAIGRFSHFDPTAPESVYIEVLDALFYTEQDRQREIERLIAEAEPGFGYATLAQLVAHPEWGERCNTILTTNFDDLAADALYLYSRRKPQVLTHESFDGRIRISPFRPTILKVHGDAHLPRRLGDNRPRFNRDVKERLRAQLTESALVLVGYGGRDESIMDMLEGLPRGAPAGGVFWVNAALPPEPMLEWLVSRDAAWAPSGDFDAMMYLMRREFDLGYPQIDRFDTILKRYDAEVKRLEAEGDAARISRGGEPTRRRAAPRLVSSEDRPPAAQRPDLETVRQSIADAYAPPTPDAADVSEAVDEFAQDLRHDHPIERAQQKRRPGSPRARAMIAAAVQGFRITDPDALADAPDWGKDPDIDHLGHGPEDQDEGPAQGEMEPTLDFSPRGAVQNAAVPVSASPLPTNPGAALAIASSRAAQNPANDVASLAGPAKDPANAGAAPVEDVAALPGRPLPDPKRFLDRDAAVAGDRLYRAAMRDAPHDGPLCARYARFLAVGRRDYDGAEHYFNRALDQSPGHDLVLRLFADFLTHVRKEHDRAEDCYRLAVKSEQISPATLCDYGAFLARARGDLDAAEECYRMAAAAAPSDPDALRRRAWFLSEARGDDDAALALLRAAAAAGDNADAFRDLGVFLAERRSDLSEASEAFEAAARLAPGDAALLLARARFADADAAAAAFLDAAAAIDPRNAAVHLAYALLLADAGDDVGAEERFIEALRADPGDPAPLTAYAQFLETRRGDFEGADNMHRRAVSVAPKSADAQSAYAQFLAYRLDCPDAAEERFVRATSFEPLHSGALAAYGAFLTRAKRLEEAEEMLRRAADASPGDAAIAARFAAFLFEMRGCADAAWPLLEAALTRAPTDPDVLTVQGRLLLGDGQEGSVETAEGAFQTALAARSNAPGALAGLAMIRFARGKTRQGAALLDQAFAALPQITAPPDREALSLELWTLRYGFAPDWREEALRAVATLARGGAQAAEPLLALLPDQAASTEQTPPEALDQVIRVAVGGAEPDALSDMVA